MPFLVMRFIRVFMQQLQPSMTRSIGWCTAYQRIAIVFSASLALCTLVWLIYCTRRILMLVKLVESCSSKNLGYPFFRYMDHSFIGHDWVSWLDICSQFLDIVSTLETTWCCIPLNANDLLTYLWRCLTMFCQGVVEVAVVASSWTEPSFFEGC